jgi:hypothetical protein
MDVGSNQNQVQNRSSQGDRVIEESDDNTSRETKGCCSNVGVFSKTVAAVRRKSVIMTKNDKKENQVRDNDNNQKINRRRQIGE